MPYVGIAKVRDLKKHMVKYELDFCTFMAVANTILFFLKSEWATSYRYTDR